jgi:hypothetical protein
VNEAADPLVELRIAFGFTISEGRITAVDLPADPERLGAVELT